MLHYHIKNQYIINRMEKILALFFLFSLNVSSQKIMNETELTTFLNTNVEGIKIEMEKEFINVKYKTHLFSDLFSNKVNETEQLHSFDLSKIIYYRTKEYGNNISLEFIFRNKESIKKAGFKTFTLSFRKKENINLAKAITTLKSYQRK